MRTVKYEKTALPIWSILGFVVHVLYGFGGYKCTLGARIIQGVKEYNIDIIK